MSGEGGSYEMGSAPQYNNGNNTAGLNRFQEAAQGNYEQAQQKAMERAAVEKEAALRAQGQAQNLAQDNYAALQNSKQAAQDMRSEMADGVGAEGGLPPAALNKAAANNLQRVQGQFAANKEMLARNREAVNQAGDEAKARMDEVQGMGRQALETAAAATVDMARGEFEARCAKVAEEEQRIKGISAEIDKRERQLAMLRNKGVLNWPCACCCFSYIVHHDILGDIPTARQGFMKRLYTNWFCTLFLLLANLAVAVTVYAIDADEANAGNALLTEREELYMQHMAIAMVAIMGMPISFLLWYWPAYKGVGSGSSSQYTLTKVGLAVAFFVDMYMAIGVTGYGGCGILYAINVRNNKHQNLAIAAFVIGGLYIIQCITFFFTYLKIRKYAKEDSSVLSKMVKGVGAIV